MIKLLDKKILSDLEIIFYLYIYSHFIERINEINYSIEKIFKS